MQDVTRINILSDVAVDDFDKAIGDIAAARAATRKFLITGQDKDRAAYDVALTDFESALKDLKKIIGADAPQLSSVVADYERVARTYVQNTIQKEMSLATDAEGRDKARALVSSTDSQTYADAMRAAAKTAYDQVNNWSDVYTAEGTASMNRILWVVVGAAALSLVVSAALAFLIIRSITAPVAAMTVAMERLAGGDTGVEVPARDQKNELGAMAQAVQVFKDNAVEKIRLEKEAAAARGASEAEKARQEAIKAEEARKQAQMVDSIAHGLEYLAQGKLTYRLTEAFPPEYERLRTDFNGAMERLQATVSVVANNTMALRSGTKDISSASDDLARRTEQQAANLEETAAALQQITETVRKTSQGAQHAHQLIAEAKRQAEQSGHVVREAVGAMTNIEKSSGQMGQIIGVIDEIAFQTNLLALNAGVEAARAGEAGRGFAVVASEVRGLAQRSAEAAKEIKTLILASSQQVEQGVDLVARTGAALEAIVRSVAEITQIVAEIAEGAKEQASGLSEINTAVTQMDKNTQQNAAMVEESTAASHGLAKETAELAKVIEGFDVGRGVAAPAPARSSSPAPSRAASAPQLSTPPRRVVNARAAASGAGRDDWAEF